MCWNWYHNPADQIGEIIARTHLTWDQVAQDSALCKELKAAVGSKTEPMFLQLNGTPIKQWYEQIMQIWNELKDSRNPADAEPVEIYLQESTEEIEGLSAIAKTQGIPQVKDTTPNFSGFHEDLKDVVSALQVTAKTLQESQTNVKPKVPDNQQDVETRRCFGCKQVGHIRANCPSKPQFNRENGAQGQNRNRNFGNRNLTNNNRGRFNQQNGGRFPNNRNNWGNYNRSTGNNNWQSNFNSRQNGTGRGNTNYSQNRGYQANAEQIRNRIIQEGRPKASWTEPHNIGENTDDNRPALTPADHAEANFVDGLSPNERWKTETARAPMMYDQAMAHLAQAAKVDETLQLPRFDFLDKVRRFKRRVALPTSLGPQFR